MSGGVPGAPASGDLLALTHWLVDVPSVSRHEAALANAVEAALAGCSWLRVSRVDDNVVARTELGRSRRLFVGGHLDTVPPAGNAEARTVGTAVWGLGACDMKGGLAVMLELARSLRQPTLDVTWCFYACEEVARAENGLVRLWETHPGLVRADAAVLAEPTDAAVEAGCQGTMRLVVRLGGVRAHTARPFAGVNALHRLSPLLGRVSAWQGRTVTLDGCTFAEQLQAVAVSGGVAANVVPDEVRLTLNHRFAPDRDSEAARRSLDPLFEGVLDEGNGDRVDVEDAADGAPPALGHPLLDALVQHSAQPPKPKLGWTDVATMWSHGVPATNFGPGDPLLAHHPDEHVTRDSLDRAHATLAAVLTDPAWV